jgi:hypothetical protein
MLATLTWLVARSWTRALGLAAILSCSSSRRVWRRRQCSDQFGPWPPGRVESLSVVCEYSVCITEEYSDVTHPYLIWTAFAFNEQHVAFKNVYS